jgi:prephenate dehydratase
VTIRIRQQLGALPGTSLSDLREVRSHYMAINQCRTFFSAFPGIALVEDVDTALSARDVSWKKLRHVGAIGSQKAMRQYGLHILAEDIESDKNNYTRFLVISSEDAGSWNA